jgi:hypothetical protein
MNHKISRLLQPVVGPHSAPVPERQLDLEMQRPVICRCDSQRVPLIHMAAALLQDDMAVQPQLLFNLVFLKLPTALPHLSRPTDTRRLRTGHRFPRPPSLCLLA